MIGNIQEVWARVNETAEALLTTGKDVLRPQ